ncbi:hypothetical protein [Streptomyces sp. NPDC005385]|uniref:hypothetical protein n=1 Tax=Streptomyces sp. NPDC005385 TaxID=3157039 RepID=UPI00339FB7F6
MSSAAPEQAQTAGYAVAIGEALGIPNINLQAPRPELGETPTRLVVWDVLGLRDIHATAGGEMTFSQTERTGTDGITRVVIELTLTVHVAEVGQVEAVTDWEPTLVPGEEDKWRRELVAAAELAKPQPPLIEQLAAAAQTSRDIATTIGIGYGLNWKWRASERRCDDLWRRARKAGHSDAELSAAVLAPADS